MNKAQIKAKKRRKITREQMYKSSIAGRFHTKPLPTLDEYFANPSKYHNERS